ncbi:MAG: cysteine--tRNA ligase [Chlamydiia bacterium]|nr:cysteine--tRNA ligase [Chlamydiia bacterium]
MIKEIPIRFFNTETRKKEIFKTLVPNEVKIYTCGPTVYDFAHIGNFRTYVFEDILRRTLKYFGYTVQQVMNITDIDDKTIRGSMASNQTIFEHTQPYKNAFFIDLKTLGIEQAEYYPQATDYIPQMIDFIKKLLDRGVAYRSSDKSIYFSISKMPNYGRLSHLKLSELKVGAGDARVAFDEYEKDHAADFVLWKFYDEEKDGQVYWESPFGRGRPGWHLECSTMATEILGETLDIHVGAVDNIFPHHENEIAQSEAMSGKTFVHTWLHSEHLLVNHKKMSKSLGNFYTLRDLQKQGYHGSEIRYMLMQTHYRTQMNFTFDGLNGARTSLHRLIDFMHRMQEHAGEGETTSDCRQNLRKAEHHFNQALADDLNISLALASLFDLTREINIAYDRGVLTPADANAVVELFKMFNLVLNIFDFKTDEGPSTELIILMKKRKQARKEKNFKEADRLRDEIYANGYEIEDTPNGSRLKKM